MSEQRPEPGKVHGDPLDPSTDHEVETGEVTEDPAAPEEDGSNPHLEPDDPDRAPRDPANITDAHPSNQPKEA